MKILRVFKFYSLVVYLGFLLSPFLIGEVSAATYYVSPNGSDSNSGSKSSPFKTIQRAADVVNPEDTVIVADGTYTDTNGDDRVVVIRRAGTSSRWITFKSENKWGAKLNGTGANRIVNFDSDAAYIRFEDFELYGGSVIDNQCDAISIGSNSESDTAHHIYLYRLKIRDICRVASKASTGLAAIDSAGSVYSSTIDSCIFYNIGRLNPNTTPSASESSCTTGGSVICYNHDHAIYSRGGGLRIINNIFYPDIKSGYPIHLYALRTQVHDAEIVNNTFYGFNPERNYHILMAGSYGYDDILIQNNIFSNPRNYAIQKPSASTTNMVIKNNLVYGASLIDNNGCSDSDFTCANNIVGKDPKFVDLTNRDFHLQIDSPAINKGLSFEGRTKDADGNSIIDVPDIGAYEAGSGGPTQDNTPPAPPAIIEVK